VAAAGFADESVAYFTAVAAFLVAAAERAMTKTG
jgi:hypothetical protein